MRLDRRSFVRAVAGALGLMAGASQASADNYNFRMASGHAPQTGYVRMMAEQFVPRVTSKLEAMGHKATFN